MNDVKAFPLRTHGKAKLLVEEFDDRLELKLVNKDTGEVSERNYYKVDEGITVYESAKIDAIIYFMHNEIKLDLWDLK